MPRRTLSGLSLQAVTTARMSPDGHKWVTEEKHRSRISIETGDGVARPHEASPAQGGTNSIGSRFPSAAPGSALSSTGSASGPSQEPPLAGSVLGYGAGGVLGAAIGLGLSVTDAARYLVRNRFYRR
jgi:hypothetical protein